MKEEEEEVKRREEEAERRRMARLMDELNQDADGGQDSDRRQRRMDLGGLDSEDGDMSERDEDRVFQDFDEDDFDSQDDMDDDLERERPRFNRNQSAKALGRGNLNDKRVTADDYVHQLKVKSQRKGRYGITVPEPFAFESRDQ